MKCRIAVVSILFFLQSFTVFAHASEPRLEINVDRLNPGGSVEVRGVAFDYEEVVTLVLIGSQSDIPLGDIPASVEGEFLHIVVLPADLPDGTYYIRGTTAHHWVISPVLTVWGIAYEEGGGQGPRDEDDSLLAPMPTFAPGVVPGAVTASAPIAAVSAPVAGGPGQELPASPGLSTNSLVLAVLMVFMVILLFGRMLRRRLR